MVGSNKPGDLRDVRAEGAQLHNFGLSFWYDLMSIGKSVTHFLARITLFLEGNNGGHP